MQRRLISIFFNQDSPLIWMQQTYSLTEKMLLLLPYVVVEDYSWEEFQEFGTEMHILEQVQQVIIEGGMIMIQRTVISLVQCQKVIQLHFG